jgi:hypothetical protein
MTQPEPNEVYLGLADVEFDEAGRAIIANEALARAVRDAKARAETEEAHQRLVISVHSW